MLGRKMLGCWPQPGDKLLWIRFFALGDVLQTAASAHRFKLRYPHVSLTFLTDPKFYEILSQQSYIDQVICWDTKKINGDFLKILSHVRKEKYKWLVSMHRGSSAAFTALFSGIPKRFGYNGGMQFAYTGMPWEFLDAIGVDFTCRDEPSLFVSSEDLETGKKYTRALPEKRLFAVIGASQRQKLWPAEHWIKFLRPLLVQGWGVLLNGHGEKELHMANQIEEALKHPHLSNLVGKLDFRAMAAVAKCATVAVGNDTGPLHLAALLGTPTLGFFGVTDAYEMLYRMPWFRQLKVTCPSAGCHNYHCPKDCLKEITPEQAWSALLDIVR